MRMQDAKAIGNRHACRNHLIERFPRGTDRLFAVASRRAPQDRIYQGSRRGFARSLHQLHRFIYRRACWNAFEKAKLVETHAERKRHRQIELCDRFLELAIEQEIEKPAPAKHAESDLGSECGVLGRYTRAKLGMKHIAGIRAFCFHAVQHFKCDRSRWTNWHRTMKSHPQYNEKRPGIRV